MRVAGADREPFYRELRRRQVGGHRLPVRIAEDGEVLFEIELERLHWKWILLKPLKGQTDRSVELSNTDLQHQRHGLVIRGDEAAGAVRIDEVDQDAVVMQRRADVRNWVAGFEDVDKHYRLGVDTPVRQRYTHSDIEEFDRISNETKNCVASSTEEVF